MIFYLEREHAQCATDSPATMDDRLIILWRHVHPSCLRHLFYTAGCVALLSKAGLQRKREKSWKIMKYKFPDINLDTCCQAKSINRLASWWYQQVWFTCHWIGYPVPKCPISLTLSTRLPAPPNSSATSDQPEAARMQGGQRPNGHPGQPSNSNVWCGQLHDIFFGDAPWLQSLPGLLAPKFQRCYWIYWSLAEDGKLKRRRFRSCWYI